MKLKSFKYLVLAGGISIFASVAHAGFQFEGAPTMVPMPMVEEAPAAVMPPVTAEPIGQPMIPPAATAEFDTPMDMGMPSSSGYAKGGAFQATTYMKTKMDDPTAGMQVASLPPTTAGMKATPDQSLIIRNNRQVNSEPAYVATPGVPMTESQSWRARQGDSVRDVLERWSSRAGVNLVWDNAGSATLNQDISHFGTFESAVDELIHKSTGTGLESQFQDANMASSYMPANTYEPAAYGRDYTNSTYSGYGDNRWEVAQGSSLRSILEQWSQRNGTKIIWNANTDYSFNQPFFVNGSYEQAVERALDQFSGTNRPYGEIYQDPMTGAPILVVNNG